MVHNPRKTVCSLGAAAILLASVAGCGPGGKLTNCASLGDRGSPTASHENGLRTRFADLQLDPPEKWGPSNCR